MADDAIEEESVRNPPLRRAEGAGAPTAILLYPFHATPPGAWRQAWVKAGWSVTLCDGVEEIRDAVGHPGELSLVVSPWPGAGDIGSVGGMVGELQKVIVSLGAMRGTREGLDMQGGMMRRGDFLSQLSEVMRVPETGCCALLAIRVDKGEKLAGELDNRTAIFDLEERIAERIADVLGKDDPYTIWLEFGFGALIRRESSEQVHALAELICRRVAGEPFVVAGEPARLTVSVGVALPPRGGATEGSDRWFAASHAAQAIAFRHGGNCHEGILTRDYEPIPAERVLIIREWVQEAKTGENVLVEFQPVLPLTAGAADLYSVHAKLRDLRAPLGGVYRREYLRIAREAGAMVMIDRMCLFGAFEALEQERARGAATDLMVPVEPATIEGLPWRWLEAELRRHPHIANRLILELEASAELSEPDGIERLLKLRAFGVRIGVSDRTGGLEHVQEWSRLPVDLLRLQFPVVEAVSPEVFRSCLASWRDQGRQVIVDSVERGSDLACFNGLGVDYLRGLAAIGPRLDYQFD